MTYIISHIFSVPKVSIDGQSHGELLMIAIISGSTVAFVIIVILVALVRPKNKSDTDDELKVMKIVHFGEFVMTTPPSCKILPSNSSSQKSNLMFKYFGKSLKSFDVVQPIPHCNGFMMKNRLFYQNNIENILTTISDSLTSSGCFDSQKIIDQMEN